MFDRSIKSIMELEREHFLTAPPHTTVSDAARLMATRNAGAVLVVQDERLVGIFTERDVVRALATHGAAALAMPIADLIKRPLAQCREQDSVETVLQLMDKHQVRMLPVMQEHTLIGVISISDIIRDAVAHAGPLAPAVPSAALHA